MKWVAAKGGGGGGGGGLMRRRGERRLDRKDGGEGVTNIERCI